MSNVFIVNIFKLNSQLYSAIPANMRLVLHGLLIGADTALTNGWQIYAKDTIIRLCRLVCLYIHLLE